MITQEQLKQFLHYDPETGFFTWIKGPRSNIEIGSIAGSIDDGYIVIRFQFKNYRAHRLAWFYMNGEFPKNHIDHIDGNRANNKFINLRLCTNSENQQNRVSNKNTSSKFVGVSWYKPLKKWVAQIRIKGKLFHKGYFNTEEDAFAAYCKAKQEAHTFNPIVRDCI